MELQSTCKEGIVTIVISGRVDTTEAAKLQKEALSQINQYDEVESIVVDATKMSFISSTGLRVILTLKKKFNDLRIIGACQDVYNVFKLTGFNKIIPIEKALDSMSVDDCEKVEGMKDVYRITEDTVLKLFPANATKAEVDSEIAMTKEAFVMGIPTAMVFDPVMVGERFGLMYESTTPLSIKGIELGEMLRNLHEQKVDPDGKMPSYLDSEKKRIRSLAPYLGTEAVESLLQMLSVLPDATSVLHGNLSLSCIAERGGEAVFTNMGQAGYGHPILDLAHLYATLTEEQRSEYFEELLDAYYDLESEETIKRHRENIVILSLITKFTDLLAGNPSDEDIEKAKAAFKELITDRWDEILSRLRFKMDFNEEIRKLERKRFYLDGDVDIDWIAKHLGTNRHYVSDYFNKVLHTTFNEYINTLRLDYAAQLLREGRVPKSQVCYDAGFNNDHTFRRLFKQKFGCLPTQYIKDNQ